MDYSFNIVNIQNKLKELEKSCLSGVVSDTVYSYIDIKNLCYAIQSEIYALERWAVLKIRETTNEPS